jgi:hypothetical protein
MGGGYGYPDLRRFGWKPGVYRSPVGYQHKWLCVSASGTSGHWTRAEAREAFRQAKEEERLRVLAQQPSAAEEKSQE